MITLLLLLVACSSCRNVSFVENDSNFRRHDPTLEGDNGEGPNYSVVSEGNDELVPYMEWNVEVDGDSWMIEYFVCAEPDEGADCEVPRIFRVHLTDMYEVESTVATADAVTAGTAEVALGVNNGTSGLTIWTSQGVVKPSPDKIIYRYLNLAADRFHAYMPVATEDSLDMPTPDFAYTARSDELTVLLSLNRWTFASDSTVIVVAGHVEYLVDSVATAFTTDDANGTVVASDLIDGRGRVGLDIATTVTDYDKGAEVTFDGDSFLIRLPTVQEDDERTKGGDLRFIVKTHVDCTGRECGGICGTCDSTDFCGDGQCYAKRVAARKDGGCSCTGSLSSYYCCQENACGTGCYQSITSTSGVPDGKTCCAGTAKCGCGEIYSLTYCGDGMCDDAFETEVSCPDDCEVSLGEGVGGGGDGESGGEGTDEAVGEGAGLDNGCDGDCPKGGDGSSGAFDSSTSASSTLTLFGMRLKS